MKTKLARKEYVDKETNYSQVYNDWGLKGFVKKCKGMTIVHVEGTLNNNTSSAGDAYPIITFSNSLVDCPHVIGYRIVDVNGGQFGYGVLSGNTLKILPDEGSTLNRGTTINLTFIY